MKKGSNIMFDQLIDFLDKHSVLILGFGREGKSTYNIIRRHLPDKKIGIADIKEIDIEDESVNLHTGNNYIDCIGDYEVIIKTPGISLSNYIIPKDAIITCQTDLFLHYADCPCVGITGTKGKTTVAALIFQMLRRAGKDAVLIGNVALPALDTLEDREPEVAVVEMSSRQLEFTTASPHIAVLTNIYPEHIEHHNGFTGYVTAKLNIARHQTADDYFICNAAQSFDEYCNFSRLPSTVIKVASDISGYERVYEAVEQNVFLVGNHSMQNAFMAAAAARRLGLSDDCICDAILDFKGIEHRLEPIGTFDGIKFYNDAIATIPQATICAIEGLGNVDTLIFGGMSVGVPFDEFENYLFGCNIPNLIGLPDTGRRICTNLANRGCTKNLILAEDMESAVEKAFIVTKRGKSCLMSPAASSYNVYKDYEHKGKHFKKLVTEHGEIENVLPEAEKNEPFN